jgi:hypothetical protein
MRATGGNDMSRRTESRLLPADLEDQIIEVARYRHEYGPMEMPHNRQKEYFKLRQRMRQAIREKIMGSPLFVKRGNSDELRFRIPRPRHPNPPNQPGEDILAALTERLLDHFIEVGGESLTGKRLPIDMVKGTNEFLVQTIIDVLQSVVRGTSPGISRDRGIRTAAYVLHIFGLEEGEVEKVYGRLNARLSPGRTKIKKL